MNEPSGSTPERGDRNTSWSLMTVLTIGPAAVILAISAVTLVDYLLAQASPEGLAATSRALIATGVVGLLVLTVIAAVRLVRSARDHRGGPGWGSVQPPEPVPSPSRMGDELDGELIRLIDAERLRGR